MTSRWNARGVAAATILVAWAAGLGVLVRREYFRPHVERLAEAALRVAPGAVFYAVLQGDRQVGFASSTLDTSTNVIEQRDYLVADIPVNGKLHRATARTNVTMTRTLRVRRFEVEVEADQGPVRVVGNIDGDSVIRLDLAVGKNAKPDTARVAISGPILLPTLVPLAVALGEKPSVGKSFTLPIFDAATMGPKDVRLDVQAESLFVVNDSSVYDSSSGRWHGVLPDTVRAWQIVSQSGSGVGGWVDAQGRLVASTQMGFHLQRRPYEVAFENWRKDAESQPADTRASAANRDVLESTAIAANKRLGSGLEKLTVRLGGVPLTGFDLRGGRQRLRRDTLRVERERPELLAARFEPILQPTGHFSEQLLQMLSPEPLLEVRDPAIQALARRLSGSSKDVGVIAQRINRWVHDSLKKEVTIGIPSAAQVLKTRRGDCNEHAQLYVALARAAGIPARVVAGLAYVDGKFYYHAWPEVLLRGWVAVDPTFGQFPADAAHLRFVTGGLASQAKLLRLVGGLTIDVLETQ